ncbi:M23 family metallopeptidase [Salinibacterium sp. G-O1]|uniref:M23 family metallopeptidase n=1 Tax=Salinibacterium sp. G-O1 TaxID=3046208 RepID=UPI0024B9C1B3|nr:M23 family metallopeptidase [Salinibacterium sp. G-O1]MDJ0335594.1 M23 family metallopeptidase [Salinibacterium sp. G-O1]
MSQEFNTPISSPRRAAARRRPGFLGFIRSQRRVVLVAAVAAVGLLTSIPSPAPAAFALDVTRAAAQSQSLTTSPAVVAPPVRDDFAMTEFSVVQWSVPASTPISSTFGTRECSGCSTDHKGTDFNPGSGYSIEAIAAGVVTEAGWDSTGYGNKVVVEHVIDGQVVSSLYAHMLDSSITVNVGDTVARGQSLGLVGSTGESTGAHLHLGIIVNGTFIDPYAWLSAHVNA